MMTPVVSERFFVYPLMICLELFHLLDHHDGAEVFPSFVSVCYPPQ
jgi:hypothetical protein